MIVQWRCLSLIVILFASSGIQAQEASVEDLIGRLLLLSFRGTEPPLEQLRAFQPAGFIFFPGNVPSTDTVRRLTSSLQQEVSYPLLFAIDQEGGPINSYRDNNATVFPGNMALGAVGDENLAKAVGQATAEELAYLGMNLNFAPSVDVNVNPDNPVISIRSFGADPSDVARLAVAYHEGLIAGGVASTAKHFPGHGDTNVDSHLALPVIDKTREALEGLELVPFRALIDAGVPVIMTSHILFSELDTEPATLSKTILTDLLRNDLGFQGVVVTDYMDMKAIADNYGAGEAAVLSVLAGSDLVLIGSNPETQQMVYQALVDAYQQGRLSEARIREAVVRSSQLATTFPARWDTPLPDYATHHDLALEVAYKSVTLLLSQVLPLEQDDNMLIIAPQPDIFGLPIHFGSVMKKYGTGVRSALISESPTEEEIQAAVAKADSSDILVLAAYQWLDKGEGLEGLAEVLLATGKPLIVVTIGNPNALSELESQFAAYVAVYGFREVNLEAAAQLLFGQTPKGKLPVPVGEHPIDWGLEEF